MPVVLIHINNEDPVLGEVTELPGPNDLTILVKNPRRKDGKDLPFLESNVTTVIWPMSRIMYIEVLPTGEEEEMIGFVRK